MEILTYLFLCIVWGTTWVAIKISLIGLPPFLGAGIRFVVASLLLLGFIRLRKINLRLDRRLFLIVFSSAFLMYALDYGFIYWAEQHLTAGVTAIFFATFPLFTGIWSNFLFRNEKFNRLKFLGILVGFIGILIVFSDQLIATQFSQSVILASLAVITGAAGGAMSLVIVKKYLGRVNPIALSFHQMIWGVFFLLLFGFLFEDASTIQLNWQVVSAVLYLGAIGSALAFALYYWLLQKLSAITLSLIIYITPIVAVITDYFVLGEVVNLRTLLGMLVIFSGIALTQWEWKNLYLSRFRLKEDR